MRIAIIITLLFHFSPIFSQDPTIGLVYNSEEVSDGYTLFTPENNNVVYLINNCGGVVNNWTFQDQPNRTCYLLENGDVLRAGKEFLQLNSWDDQVKWSFDVTTNELGQHHDIEPLPNGNILVIVYDRYSKEDIIIAGRNPEKSDAEFQLDKIVELEMVGSTEARVVWEWKMYDHLIQDFDQTKANFGTVSESPGRFDINFDNNETSNFAHINGIDYNPELDQILFSARNLSEIFIIDHSTTKEEAASSSGGLSGQGGDILWRWGNPLVYKKGDATAQKLFRQHDPKWIPKGYLNEGKITVFNNRPDVDFSEGSSVHIVSPEISDNVYLLQNETFLPEAFHWSWSGDLLDRLVREEKKSGVHALPNGNLIVCETGKGRVSEIDQAGQLVWSYINPIDGIQYNPSAPANGIFRGEKYVADYPAFDGRSLDSEGFLENENPLSAICGEITRNNETLLSIDDSAIRIENPIVDGTLRLLGEISQVKSIEIMTLSGVSLAKYIGTEKEISISISQGIYFVLLDLDGTKQMSRIIIL